MKLNNKLASDKQEKMIASYLGWRQVKGSGARPTFLGDVESDRWLGECKTHNTLQDHVVFMKNHWTKICEEAASKFKFPVLFTDDGSQRSNKTWCIFKAPTYKSYCRHIGIIDSSLYKNNKSSFVIPSSSILKYYLLTYGFTYIELSDGVYLTSLETFSQRTDI